MTNFKSTVRRFLNDESGASLVEYALLVAVIAVGAIAAMKVLRNNIANSFNNTGAVIANP